RVSRHYSMLMTTNLRTTACGRVGYVGGFRIQIRKQIPRIDIRDSQGRHAYRGELSRQSECRRIFGGEHLFRIADETCKPSPITPRGYVAQVGPDTITPSNRVARRTEPLEQGLARLVTQCKGCVAHFIAPRVMDLV